MLRIKLGESILYFCYFLNTSRLISVSAEKKNLFFSFSVKFDYTEARLDHHNILTNNKKNPKQNTKTPL